jgi:hypothetical protein
MILAKNTTEPAKFLTTQYVAFRDTSAGIAPKTANNVIDRYIENINIIDNRNCTTTN